MADPFRFMDLPPEMRNRIYAQALVHDRDNGRRATIGFLTACKQIHAEAKGIFYGLSTFTVNMRPVRAIRPSGVSGHLDLWGDIDVDLDDDETSVVELRSWLPSQMSQVQTIKIRIFLRAVSVVQGPMIYEPYEEAGNRFLYTMAHYLNTNNSSCKLLVEVSRNLGDAPLEVSSADFRCLLLPLRILHPRIELELLGLPQLAQFYFQPYLDIRTEVPDESIDPVVSYIAHKEKLMQTLCNYPRALQHKVSLGKAAMWCLAVLGVGLKESFRWMGVQLEYEMHIHTIALEAAYVALTCNGSAFLELAKKLVRRLFPMRQELRYTHAVIRFSLQVLTPLCELLDISRDEWYD
ncbi:hypothetical protein PRZ48_010988 [Zasmidium cellare]|uniref:Uncharacterized protein n=1 Tax=Zasmidium cellare TaxID=395010 RepID=A0ABR0EB15_ZASCE|nr:hypothetical protein PRZ48_010988 [Zasmidium cellare]